MCSLSFLLLSKKKSRNSYDDYNVLSVDAMLSMTVKRLEHMLMSISPGAQGVFKWIQWNENGKQGHPWCLQLQMY